MTYAVQLAVIILALIRHHAMVTILIGCIRSHTVERNRVPKRFTEKRCKKKFGVIGNVIMKVEVNILVDDEDKELVILLHILDI